MKKTIVPTILFLMLLFSSGVAAHPGIGIVMDSNGNVFYTDLAHVWKITPDGSHSIVVEDVHTHELYLDKNDNLYGEHSWYEGEATDKWGYYIWCLNSNGSLEQIIPPTEGFPLNNTLVRDSEGSMYWPEKSGGIEILKKETANGKTSLYTDHKFKDIRWLHFSKDENLYVVDFLKLKKVTPNGEVQVITDKLKETGPPHAGVADHHYLMGAWTDAQQNIFVAVYGARKVKKITPRGKIETIFKTSTEWSPSGGLNGTDGSLWVMEFSVKNTTRVRKISLNGEETVYNQN